MGRLANAALMRDGEVIGVIPNFLMDLELGHNDVTELKVVESMHKREHILLTEAECIFVLPGGIGTIEEFMQAISWKYLKIIDIPIILININNYFQPLISMLEKSISERFMVETSRDLYYIADSVEEAVKLLDVFSIYESNQITGMA